MEFQYLVSLLALATNIRLWWKWLTTKHHMVQVGPTFEFIKLISFLKTQLGGCIGPLNQTVASLFIPPWLAKPAGKMIIAQLQWIRQTQKFDRQGHYPRNYDTELFTTVKSFIVQGPWVNRSFQNLGCECFISGKLLIKTFSSCNLQFWEQSCLVWVCATLST